MPGRGKPAAARNGAGAAVAAGQKLTFFVTSNPRRGLC